MYVKNRLISMCVLMLLYFNYLSGNALKAIYANQLSSSTWLAVYKSSRGLQLSWSHNNFLNPASTSVDFLIIFIFFFPCVSVFSADVLYLSLDLQLFLLLILKPECLKKSNYRLACSACLLCCFGVMMHHGIYNRNTPRILYRMLLHILL